MQGRDGSYSTASLSVCSSWPHLKSRLYCQWEVPAGDEFAGGCYKKSEVGAIKQNDQKDITRNDTRKHSGPIKVTDRLAMPRFIRLRTSLQKRSTALTYGHMHRLPTTKVCQGLQNVRFVWWFIRVFVKPFTPRKKTSQYVARRTILTKSYLTWFSFAILKMGFSLWC